MITMKGHRSGASTVPWVTLHDFLGDFKLIFKAFWIILLNHKSLLFSPKRGKLSGLPGSFLPF